MILERINRHYAGLTKSQQSLADYVVRSYQTVAFMTASRLAEAVEVNESTVIRFAQRLGYEGFPDMVRDIRALVHQDLEPGGVLTVGPEEEGAFYSALAASLESVGRCTSRLPAQIVRSARESLATAGRVLVIGQGRAMALGTYLAEGLCAVGVEAQPASPDSLFLEAAFRRGDPTLLVVGVGLGERTEGVAEALQRAGESGLDTLALSDSGVSPCAQAAEVVLVCSAGGGPHDGAGALVMVMDALIASLGPRS